MQSKARQTLTDSVKLMEVMHCIFVHFIIDLEKK